MTVPRSAAARRATSSKVGKRTRKTGSARRPPSSVRTEDVGLAIGARIRTVRIAAGLSQADLAGERLSRFAISKIETGSSVPSLAVLEYLAKELGVSPRSLIPPQL